MSNTSQHDVAFMVGAQRVSGLLAVPDGARACYVLAHGAGAGMRHRFMNEVAEGLAARDIATLRYQFPYMERGGRRPDSPAVAQATVRGAVGEASILVPHLPLFAGGKSYGGRMTSEAQAQAPLAGVRGLIFLGFPLHPPGQPSENRAEHLSEVAIPMLFLQGTRDEFAELRHLNHVIAALGSRATLKLISDGNHSFEVPAKTGRKHPEVMAEILDTLAAWIDRLLT